MAPLTPLHPRQFQIDEAWIAFQLNDEPIVTEQEGSFNCFALIDAASGFILSGELVSVDQAEPTQLDAKRLLNKAWEYHELFPRKLLVPRGQFRSAFPKEARRLGIAVERIAESRLLAFIAEPRAAYKEFNS